MTASQVDQRYWVKGTVVNNFKQYIATRFGKDYLNEIHTKSGFCQSGVILSSTWYPIEKYLIMQEMAAMESSKLQLPLIESFPGNGRQMT